MPSDIDKEEFLRREREADARRREALLKSQNMKEPASEVFEETAPREPRFAGVKEKLADFGERFKRKELSDAEFSAKVKKIKQKAELMEAEARLARARRSKSQAGGGGFLAELSQIASPPAPRQSRRREQRRTDDYSGYLQMFDPAAQASSVGGGSGLDMSAYLQNFMPSVGPAPRKGRKKARRSNDPIAMWFE